MKKLLILPVAVSTALFSSCATITEDEMTPVSLSFSDGSTGSVTLNNKRGTWESKIPAIVSVRKSDDALKFSAKNKKGYKSTGSIPSTMGPKIVASALFLDFGIVDAITDKHRKYPSSFVIPMKKK